MKRTIRTNSSTVIRFIQRLKDFEIIYIANGGYGMSYEEYKQLCWKIWEAGYIYLCIDRSKRRDQGGYCICNESKITKVECTPETKLFWINVNVVFN